MQVDLVGMLAVPVALVSWLGLAPAWSFDVSPQRLPRRLVEARLLDPTVAPPPDADESLLEVWSQPWVQWRIRLAPSGRSLGYLSAGSYYGLTGDDSDVVLAARPSAAIWRDLLSVIDTSVRP